MSYAWNIEAKSNEMLILGQLKVASPLVVIVEASSQQLETGPTSPLHKGCSDRLSEHTLRSSSQAPNG